MAFNPFKNFGKSNQDSPQEVPDEYQTEEIKSKVIPMRDSGGKFVSKKSKEEIVTKEEPVKELPNTDETPEGPFPITFYGHELRRFRYKNDWYFVLDDVAAVAYINPDDPRVRKGDPERLAEEKKKYALKFDGIEVAKPKDLINLVPYFKGNMPGPITSWLSENSSLPVPKAVTDNTENE